MNKKKRGPENFDEALLAAQEELTAKAPEKQGETDLSFEEESAGAEMPDPNEKLVEELQRAVAELTEENSKLKELIAQESRAREAEVIKNSIAPPKVDNESAFANEHTDGGENAYAQGIADSTRGMAIKERSPQLEGARGGADDAAWIEALHGLSGVPEFSDIIVMEPRLAHIIRTNPLLANGTASVTDKLITAYAIAKGSDEIKNPKRFTADDFIKMYRETPELRRQVEMLRLERAGQDAVTLPPLSASTGAGSAPLSPPPEKPRDFEEAKKSMLARLGLN